MRESTFSIAGSIRSLLEQKKYNSLKDILTTMNPADIAAAAGEMSETELPLLFRLLPKAQAADVFAEMEPECQEQLIKAFSDSELALVINELYVDDAADLIEDMPANVVKRILKTASPDLRREINEILRYPENSAGSVMTTEFVALKPEMTLDEAMTYLRRTGIEKETIYNCYVTRKGVLAGIVSLKDMLMAADGTKLIGDIMKTDVISVGTSVDREEVAKMLSRYRFMALPVVDDEERLVGIITFDDVIDVIEEETTEDIAKMAAITPPEKTYLHLGVFDLFRSRIPWLLLLMVSATFTGMIITGFEEALAAPVVLTAFIPMLMDTGGNTGSQSSVTVIRALSLDEIGFRSLPQVVWKEVRTALLCGATLAAACFCKIMLVDRLLMHNEAVTLTVALAVSLTMVVTVVVAKFIGCVLPMLAKRLGFDPAVMASPFITTIVDALSLLVYFTIAKQLLF